MPRSYVLRNTSAAKLAKAKRKAGKASRLNRRTAPKAK